MKDILEIGQIVNTRGLRGEVKLNSFSEDKHRFEKLSTMTTSFPLFNSSTTVWLPIYPVPPVTSTFILTSLYKSN